MVIVLCNELLHLRNGILATAGQMLGDVGDLSPDNETLLVAQIIEILIVLIVSKSDSSRAYRTCDVRLRQERFFSFCFSLFRLFFCTVFVFFSYSYPKNVLYLYRKYVIIIINILKVYFSSWEGR